VITAEHLKIIEWALTDALSRRTSEFAHRHPSLAENDAAMLAHLDEIREARRAVILARNNPDLLAALEPFVARNSSEEFVTITVRSADVTRARAVIAAARK
jgi:hypothetical protein